MRELESLQELLATATARAGAGLPDSRGACPPPVSSWCKAATPSDARTQVWSQDPPPDLDQDPTEAAAESRPPSLAVCLDDGGSCSAAEASTTMAQVVSKVAHLSSIQLAGSLGMCHIRQDVPDSPSFASVAEADADENLDGSSPRQPAGDASGATPVVLKRHSTPTAAWAQSGVGFTFHKATGASGPFQIVDLNPGGPARQSGRIKPGDWLHAVNDTCVHELDTQQTTELILGTPGSQVTLWIRSGHHQDSIDQQARSSSPQHSQSSGAQPVHGPLVLLEMPHCTTEFAEVGSTACVQQGLQPTYVWQGGIL